MIRITEWAGLTKPKNGKRVEIAAWADLAAYLLVPAPRSGGGWSAAIFRGDHRLAANTEAVDALVLDVDTGNVSLTDLALALDGVSALAQETKSSTPDDLRWRIVVELARPCESVDEYARTWTAMRDRLAIYSIRLDESAKDSSRFWYRVAKTGVGVVSFEGLPVEIPARETDHTSRAPVRSTPATATRRSSYVSTTFENACNDIASCAKGGRNAKLFAKSCTVFEYFIGEGRDPVEACADLQAAGEACGLPRAEVGQVLGKALAKVYSTGKVRVAPTLPERESPPRAAPAAFDEDAELRAHVEARGDDLDDWRDALPRTKDGAIKATFRACVTIVRHVHGARIGFNRMVSQPCLDGVPLTDGDLYRLREKLEADFGVSFGVDQVQQALLVVAEERPFHPLQDYLSGLAWDGTSRIERVAEEILGLHDATALEIRMLQCFFLSAVARAMNPGCKVDTILVLVGEQSFKKSSFFKAIAGDEFFSDTRVDLRHNVNASMQLHAAWIYEWAEIEGVIRGGDNAGAKAFITSAVDGVRLPYAKTIVQHARSGIIVGSTNERFLTDTTGSRRFHPIRVERVVDIVKARAWRDQLWAEAVHLLAHGVCPRCVAEGPGTHDVEGVQCDGGRVVRWWLTVAEERQREAAAVEHLEENLWTAEIRPHLYAYAKTGVTTAEVYKSILHLDIAKIDRAAQTRIGLALRELGWWSRRVRMPNGQREWRYEPKLVQVGTSAKQEVVPTVPTVPTSLYKWGDSREGEG